MKACQISHHGLPGGTEWPLFQIAFQVQYDDVVEHALDRLQN